MAVLARLKILRGGWLDPFGYMAERRMERQLIVTYRGMIDWVLNEINAHNYDLAVQFAQTPDQIRGFGPVKHEAVGAVEAEQKSLLAQFRRAGTPASRSYGRHKGPTGGADHDRRHQAPSNIDPLGTYRVDVEERRVTALRAFEHDPDPSAIGSWHYRCA